MSAHTSRTLKELKAMGRFCGMVEKFNQYAGPHGRRFDLFGFIDIIALDLTKGVVAVQSFGASFSAHYQKVTQDKAISRAAIRWLLTPGTSLEFWGWKKKKVTRGGKAVVWTSRVQEITLDDFDPSVVRGEFMWWRLESS